MNGGHSAALFLQAAGRGGHLTMFDLGEWSYSRTAVRLIERLFPRQLEYVEGNSHTTLPQYVERHGATCDVFSVDGGHGAIAVLDNLASAHAASRARSLVLLDDMTTHRADMGRPLVDAAAKAGLLSELSCTPDVLLAVPRTHRFLMTNASDAYGTPKAFRMIAHAYCHARFGSLGAGLRDNISAVRELWRSKVGHLLSAQFGISEILGRGNNVKAKMETKEMKETLKHHPQLGFWFGALDGFKA